ncbi:dTDP-4-dehydrorhamnose 3,5-epimerase [Winogradskyella tangerina]|uniref:dTDP-4-dehydrorhamnose 3,5-epimerase n=1 Tax=Winogradskyella tangerina TaxID=2023240 RepID=UPI000DBE735E|nr:dTDP-4-dehydrorhamnose 3,5-epimerase [Winogradskyella tangerina]
MTVQETKLKGSYILQPQIFEDKRGYFIESFNKKTFEDKTGLKVEFVQDNESLSSKGVLRGLHYQRGEYAQAKLVRVIKGKVLDVVVDLRPDSSTYGEHFSIVLSEENKTQFYVPRGFAHGFLVLEDHTIFNYKCDNYYNKQAEGGIIYNDAELNIDWNFPMGDLIISEKDLLLPSLKNAQL